MDVLADALLLAGALLVVLAGLGVLRLGDLYARMHAATKVPSLAVVLIGAGAAVEIDDGRAKILLAVAFILVTAPTGAHLVGRAAHRAHGVAADLPGGDALADEAGPQGEDGA